MERLVVGLVGAYFPNFAAEEYGVYPRAVAALEDLAAEWGLELLADVNSPCIKLHLDTFHLNIEEENIADAIRTAGPWLGHLHCSENNRRRPGAGHIPWTAVRQALDDIGYTGWIVMESFVRPEGEVGRTLSIWRPLADDLDAEAQAGARFMRRELAGV
jgi:D-psicose/D-tagatose/L-ribulose 3-epimerase